MTADPYRFTGPRREGESWSARHERMLMALPDGGGTIVVITNEIGRSLMRALRTLRGFRLRKAWRFVAVKTYSDCAKLDGLRGAVIVDWTIEAHANEATRAGVRQSVAEIHATHP